MTTRRRSPLLAAPLLFGACELLGRPPPLRPAIPEAETPQQRACLEQARAAEPVRDLERQRNPQNTPNWERLAEEATVRLNRAYRDCLRREGLALPGGVEAVRSR